jgi:hypothetical protein
MSAALSAFPAAGPPPDHQDQPPPDSGDTSQGPPADSPDQLQSADILPLRPPAPDQSMADPRQSQGEQRPLLLPQHARRFARWIVRKNIADEIEDTERQRLADQAKREYDLDEETRADWKQRYSQWMDFALQVMTPKTYPWADASNVCFPLITVAALQFNARAYPAIVQGRNVVKGTVIGDDRGVPLMMPPQPQQGMMGGPGGPAIPGQPAPGGMGGPPQGMPPGAPPGMPQGGPQGAPQGPQPAMGPGGKPLWIQPPGSKQSACRPHRPAHVWQLLSRCRNVGGADRPAADHRGDRRHDVPQELLRPEAAQKCQRDR